MVRSLIAVLFCVCLFLTASAQASPIDREGAARLREIFARLIENQKTALVPSLGVTLLYDGAVTVEQTRTYYAVTLPRIEVLYRDGRVFKLGMISVNVVPDEVRGRWRMKVAMPMPMVMLDKDDRPIMSIRMGEQQAEGIWDERLGAFIKFDGIYKDLNVDGNSLAYSAHIPELKTTYDFADNAMRFSTGDAVLRFVLGELFRDSAAK